MKTAKIWYIVILFFCILGLSLQLKSTRRKPTKAPNGQPGHPAKPGKTTTTRSPNANQHKGKTTTTKAPSGNQHPVQPGKPGKTTTTKAPSGNQHPVQPVKPVKPGKTTTTKAPSGDRHPVQPEDPGHSVQPGISGQQSTCEKKEKCTIDVRHMKPEHALIVDPLDPNKLVYPARNGKIVIDPENQIYLVCSGAQNKFVKLTGQYHKFTCECGSTFKSTANKEYDFEDLTCSSIPEATYKPKSSKSIKTAAGQITIDRFDVGFKTDASNGFVTVLESHHNLKAQLTSYVKSRLSWSAKYVRQPFDWDTFFETYPGRFVQEPHKHHRVSLHMMYYVDDQRTSFKEQFPKKNNVNVEKGLLLDRGHLAPRRDMIYVAEGLATYTYINTVPQWNLINQHNWEAIESYVRNMAATLRKDLTVITGSYKRLHYPDEKNAKISKMVYLYTDKYGPQCPVPLATYKIVIDPDTNKGLVFVTSNDPYLPVAEVTPTPKNLLCTEVLQLDDLKFKMIMKHGYSYVCSVKAFLDETRLHYLFGEEVLSVKENLNEAHIKVTPVPEKVEEIIQD